MKKEKQKKESSFNVKLKFNESMSEEEGDKILFKVFDILLDLKKKNSIARRLVTEPWWVGPA